MPRSGAAPALTLAIAALALMASSHQSGCFLAGRTGSAGARQPRTRTAAEGAAAASVKEPDVAEEMEVSEAAGAVVGFVAGCLFSKGSVAAGLVGCVVGYIFQLSTRQQAGEPLTSAGFDPRKEMGAMEPFGYWDPLGLMRQGVDGVAYGWEWKDEAVFRGYRQAELKHGRLAMVALTGMYAASQARFPIEGFGFLDAPNGLQAASGEAAGAIGIIFLIAGFIELENGDGNFDDPLDVKEGRIGDAWGTLDELRAKELAHGRLAMSTVFSLWLVEYGTGSEVTPSQLFTQPPTPLFLVAFVALLGVWYPYRMAAEKELEDRRAAASA